MYSQRSGKAIISGSGSVAKDTTTLLQLQNLERYSLAKCADGSTAGYYAEQRKVRRSNQDIQNDKISNNNMIKAMNLQSYILHFRRSRMYLER